MSLIGFGYKLGVGKTTCADFLKDYTKLSFASGVKDETAEFLRNLGVKFKTENLYGSQKDKDEVFFVPISDWCCLTPVELFTPAKEFISHSKPGFISLTFRQTLQLWGTEYRRRQDPDYWVKRLEEKLVGLEKVVIDDVRFLNEVEMVQRLGGRVIRIDRPGPNESTHASENELNDFDGWDGVIVNDGTLEDLAEKVREVVYDTTRDQRD